MAKKILIVDDMVSVRCLLKLLLQEEDFDLDEAHCGKVAIEKCKGENPPDLVLLDILMPEMNGIETCREIKKLNKDLPIVIITTKEEREFVEKAMAAGANAYMTKPINKMELSLRIRDLLG